MLWLPTNGVKVMQSEKDLSAYSKEEGRESIFIFIKQLKTPKVQTTIFLLFIHIFNRFYPAHIFHKDNLSLFLHGSVSDPVKDELHLCLPFLSFSHSALICLVSIIKQNTTLYHWPSAGYPPPSFAHNQSALTMMDGCCRDCRVDSMLQDLSADTHCLATTKWCQLATI